MRIIRAILWRERLRDAGQKARDEHSRWLTLALLGRSAGLNQPRIPTRKVDDGGFDRLMQDPRGRRAATRWWSNTFQDDQT